MFNIQSNLCTTATLGTPKKWPLLRGGRYSKGPPIKLVWIWDAFGSGWLLLTGGRYSEVAVRFDCIQIQRKLLNVIADLYLTVIKHLQF